MHTELLCTAISTKTGDKWVTV